MISQNNVCLIAPKLTQDLLNVKWTLRASAQASGSVWFNYNVDTYVLAPGIGEKPGEIRPLQTYDCLLFLCETGDFIPPALALLAGIRFAQRLPLIWIGAPLPIVPRSEQLQYFPTAKNFEQHTLAEMYSQLSYIRPSQLAA